MNKEQNIDDILKLLKSSYGDEASTLDEQNTENDIDSSENVSISQDELKEKLKEQFIGDSSDELASNTSYDSDDFSYAIDNEFLEKALEAHTAAEDITEEILEDTISGEEFSQEAALDDSDNEASIIVDEIIDEAEEISEDTFADETLIENTIDAIESQNSEAEEEIEEADELPPFDMPEATAYIEKEDVYCDDELDAFVDDDYIDDGLFIENEDGDIILLKQGDDTIPLTDEEEAELAFMLEEDEEEFDTLEALEKNEEYDEEFQTLEAESPLELIEDETVIDEVEAYEKELYSDDSGQLALFEANEALSEDEGDVEETHDELDESQIIMDFGDFEGEFIDPYALEDSGDHTHVDDSVLNLMIEFGDFSALRDRSVRDQMEEYLNNTQSTNSNDIDPSESFAFDGEEFEDEKQAENIGDTYRKEKLFTLLRAVGCGIFTILLFLYEFIISGSGDASVISRDTVFYPLIAIQLLVFAAIFAWRELWSGIKKAFTFKSDLWSVISIVLIFTVIHGIVVSLINLEKLYTFGTVASVYILFGLVIELFKVLREAKCFEIYSSDKIKFTFVTEAIANSSSDKMYRGGLPHSKKVFEFSSIDFPRGYFSAINSHKIEDKFINYSITPMIVISVIALILSAMLNNSLSIALSTFMVMLCAISPLSAVAAHIFPLFFASNRLYSKGCAVSSEDTVRSYAKCDYIIFKDMHLFKPCLGKDNGIVIYDEKNSRKIIEYLDSLYSAIGGPMQDVFGGISKGKYDLKIRRIARNGIEALIDSRHNIMLGDAEFLKRYGINLSSEDTPKNQRGILGFVVDGRLSAKLSIKYKVESIFEILAQKLGEEGIRCTIETYDPVINSAFVAYCRDNPDNPINVVHKNVYDYYGNLEIKSDANTGAVVCDSRLKLVELEIWCKRISKILRISSILQIIIACIAISLVALATVFGAIKNIDQYHVLLWQVLSALPLTVLMLTKLPKRKYFNI